MDAEFAYENIDEESARLKKRLRYGMAFLLLLAVTSVVVLSQQSTPTSVDRTKSIEHDAQDGFAGVADDDDVVALDSDLNDLTGQIPQDLTQAADEEEKIAQDKRGGRRRRRRRVYYRVETRRLRHCRFFSRYFCRTHVMLKKRRFGNRMCWKLRDILRLRPSTIFRVRPRVISNRKGMKKVNMLVVQLRSGRRLLFLQAKFSCGAHLKSSDGESSAIDCSKLAPGSKVPRSCCKEICKAIVGGRFNRQKWKKCREKCSCGRLTIPTKACKVDNDCKPVNEMGCCRKKCVRRTVPLNGACTCSGECIHGRLPGGAIQHAYCAQSRCFQCVSVTTRVTIRRDGKIRELALKDTRKGDEILVVDETNDETRFEKILLFHHFDLPGGFLIGKMNVLEYRIKNVTKQLKITDGHLIFARRAGVTDGSRQVMDARWIHPGDEIWVENGNGAVRPVVVTRVGQEEGEVVNVITRAGNFVAEGVFISAHAGTNWMYHRLKVAVYKLHFDVLEKIMMVWKGGPIDFAEHDGFRVFLKEWFINPLAESVGLIVS